MTHDCTWSLIRSSTFILLLGLLQDGYVKMKRLLVLIDSYSLYRSYFVRLRKRDVRTGNKRSRLARSRRLGVRPITELSTRTLKFLFQFCFGVVQPKQEKVTNLKLVSNSFLFPLIVIFDFDYQVQTDRDPSCHSGTIPYPFDYNGASPSLLLLVIKGLGSV